MLIGEVSRRSGVSTRMLRHYDALGLVTPTGRSSGGYREYCADDVRRLFHVESLRTLGLSLHDAKRALDDAEFAPAELMGDLAPEEWDDVLGILALLRALDSDSPGRRQRAILPPEAASWPADALVAALLAEEDANVAGAPRSPPSPRLRLTQALAEIPGPAARQALARLAGDGDRTIAATATAILDMLGRAERARRRV